MPEQAQVAQTGRPCDRPHVGTEAVEGVGARIAGLVARAVAPVVERHHVVAGIDQDVDVVGEVLLRPAEPGNEQQAGVAGVAGLDDRQPDAVVDDDPVDARGRGELRDGSRGSLHGTQSKGRGWTRRPDLVT